MKPKWSHPKLGTFKYGGGQWTALVDMPAFKVLAYDTGLRNARRSTGKHELCFEADDEDDVPSQRAIVLAERVIAGQKRLVESIVKALWDDFRGKGPGSGMWWNGDFDGVVAAIAEETKAKRPPKKATDLYNYLLLSQVRILQNMKEFPLQVVEISFHAPFEREHGVSVLTEGKGVLGIGFTSDVSPFRG